MKEKAYLNFFILCAILSLGIHAKFPEEDIGESSNLLIREKRVIDRNSQGVRVTEEEYPYIVNIKEQNVLHCVGTILSRGTVITAARCVSLHISKYKVVSGTVYTTTGNMHNITDKKMYGHHPPRSDRFLSGIALITVEPPFQYSSTIRGIDLHVGPVLAGTYGIITGWATCVVQNRRVETQHVRRLRSISVPIINHRDCENFYRNHFPVTEEYFCTFHSHRQCGNTDAGAPFILNNQLVGVHIGPIFASPEDYVNNPDVFVLVQHLEYGNWIRENI